MSNVVLVSLIVFSVATHRLAYILVIERFSPL